MTVVLQFCSRHISCNMCIFWLLDAIHIPTLWMATLSSICLAVYCKVRLDAMDLHLNDNHRQRRANEWQDAWVREQWNSRVQLRRIMHPRSSTHPSFREPPWRREDNGMSNEEFREAAEDLLFAQGGPDWDGLVQLDPGYAYWRPDTSSSSPEVTNQSSPSTEPHDPTGCRTVMMQKLWIESPWHATMSFTILNLVSG